MRYELFKSVLWAKSLLSLSAAYEVAAAGRALARWVSVRLVWLRSSGA